jgi:superfamily II DNA or RNA helicase
MTNTRGILEGWLYVPVGRVTDLSALKQRLTFLPRKFPMPGEEPVEPIFLFDESRPGYIGVPREFGLQAFQSLQYDDRTSLGAAITVPKLPDPHHPRVRNPQAQAQFMADLRAAFDHHRSFTAVAPTGSGKTVCALNTAALLGRRTLILVHLERLMLQWQEEIIDKLGVPPERVGIVQQNRCEWQGKDFCVGLLHSVVRRDYPEAFYRAFGLVVFDEMHKVGSQFFAPAVHLFPSHYRLGLSATPTRKDGGERVFFWHLGPIRVTSEAEALPMRVYVVPYRTRQKLWGSTHGSRIKCLTGDKDRNALVVMFIKRFWENGRNGLVVSESVQHLQELMRLAERAGVPGTAMGQFTSERHQKVADPANAGKTKWVKKKIDRAELDRVKADSRIIFATYGMFTEGIDVPRLDAGIDATPRSSATQLIGRIRRPLPGKRMPIWITLRDKGCSMSESYYQKRCTDYHASNAEVVIYGTKEESVDARGA